ncbi:hypothetical protein CCM_03374 [Cordyceps militaris CM01]|uniref:Uncharacterized protein n=1 Tax=Cordyceps militaris (strain CM01) TaxID=983644 RepID=G3JAD4_CORMM|nr:uncharacterized protein CCM_03374 [Cordyceps militaris CM01]EGX95102.1 hypothetical protein CCM_03374 [Cordyceps militaris CM01]
MAAEQRQQRDPQDPAPAYSSAPGTAESTSSSSRNNKQKSIAQYEGGAGKMISRPTPMPQYPAPETPSPTWIAGSPSSYRPPANRPSQAPQRPPRPSRIPSMVDQTRLQEPTPLFIAPVRTIKSPQDSIYSQPSPGSQYSAQYSPSTGYISDLPSANSMSLSNQQKKGAILGPPPSSRRGASSFYSNASFVSPIIEENPYARSHGSYASSAAMPDNWGSSVENDRNMNAETFYEESMTDFSPQSIYGDFGDEKRLVQPVELDSAAIPKVLNQQRPSSANRTPAGVAVNDERKSWNILGTARQPAKAGDDEADGHDIIQAYAVASSSTPAGFRMAQSSSANNTRNSAMKRGLRIDMDAVREAESRGSLTSLPDLIRRATKLAAMIDKGKRPTSRMDTLSDLLSEKQLSEGRADTRGGRPASGLSDMLAAFPPPVSTPQFNNGPNRSSWLGQGGWPLKSGPNGKAEKVNKDGSPKRRSCGLPLWAVIVATILLLCIIIAAIAVPLELFVFNKSDSANTGIEKCRTDLTCLNGGSHATLSDPRLASPKTNKGGIIRVRANDDDPFDATDTVIDFCRVSVLFVLQERGVNNAQDAQSGVQTFLTKITTADSSNGPKITQKEASNITIGNGGSLNLVNFHIDLGDGLVGGAKVS